MGMPEVQLAYEQTMSKAGEPGTVGNVSRSESWRWVTSRRMRVGSSTLSAVGTHIDGPFTFVAISAHRSFKVGVDGGTLVCNKHFAAFINTTVTVKVANAIPGVEQHIDVIIAGRGTNPA
jgi:hypothetical protein